MSKIELLAPAKNYESGIVAINYGADAVYIGANKFGARTAAGNSLLDIEKLINYAHKFHAKVFVTVNTILFDNELSNARKLIFDLYNLGIDALIIQDVGILEMDLPPIPLHASTQMNNYDLERLKFMDNVGFQRIILAREQSLEQIRAIRAAVKAELEFFVHGALCVCFSGQCYMSVVAGGRSGNRGECAQPCRKKYDLVDAHGEMICSDKHLLSIKDLNLTGHIKSLMDAGVSSLKIEGRLKDINYIKNIVGNYRQTLDRILEGQSKIKRASSGRVIFDINFDPEVTFNRGYTNYFIKGRDSSINTFNSPKSLGKKIGIVVNVDKKSFKLNTDEQIHNSDGLIFFDKESNLKGIKVNSVEDATIFPQDINGIFSGAIVYRNSDIQFDKQLKNSKTKRLIAVDMVLCETSNGISLSMTDEDGISVTLELPVTKEIATNLDNLYVNIKKQLTKLGNTIFTVKSVDICFDNYLFIPTKDVNNLRRQTVALLELKRIDMHVVPEIKLDKNNIRYFENIINYTGNVTNKLAKQFYHRHGVDTIDDGVEIIDNPKGLLLMTTKMCLKYELGFCYKYHSKGDELKDPLYLIDNNKRYRLEFDCTACVMKLYQS